MATDPDRFLGCDVYTYTQEKERFQKDLFRFHAGRGTHFLDLPTVSGKSVDLYLLYTLVNKHGGFHKVCDRNLWWKIPAEYFHFPEVCANSELALKQIYMRYLYLYERVNVHGDDPDHPDDDDSGPRGAKSGRILVHQVPLRYNYRQHRIRPSDRASHGLSTNLAKPNEYERLQKSLLSGLPNEVDFAINVCCILSMEGSSSIKLFSHRNLLELLLAHVGIFSENSSLQHLYLSEWFPKTRRNFTQFWYEHIECADLDYAGFLLDMISSGPHRQQDQQYYLTKSNLIDSELFQLGRDEKDAMIHRVKQISHILRNLSFDVLNSKAMSETPLVFNFSMLCCHNTLPQLKHNGLDILENISKQYVIPAVQESSTQLIVRCLHRWLSSQDKLELVGALLVVAALAKVEQNEECLVEALPQDIYSQIVSLARIYDLQLIVAALDALYYLSEIGEGPCNSIALVKHCIDFLANLVTVETQSFGESALGGVIVRDHRIAQTGQPPRPVGTVMGPPATPFTPRPVLKPQAMPGQPPMQATRPQTPPAASPVGQPATPQHIAPNRPMLSRTPSHRTILPATPQNLASMSPEVVSCNWLRANYEPYPGLLISTAKVYQEYIHWLQRRGGPAAVPVPTSSFVASVKKAFPYSDVSMHGQESQISGMRWKAPLSPHPQGNVAGPNVTAQVQQVQQPPPAYGAAHLLSPGNPGMPPRISSPSLTTSNDMLRSMLLSESSRPRSNSSATSSTVSSGRVGRGSWSASRAHGSRSASPRAKSSTDSPLPPLSPVSSMELQVCGNAEKVESFVNGASLARIERVENPMSSDSQVSPPEQTSVDSSKSGGQRNGSGDIGQFARKRSDGSDSALCVSDQSSSVGSRPNGLKENGASTPSDTLGSPPLCNGHSSDTDSLLAEPTRQSNSKLAPSKINGSGDSNLSNPPVRVNGLLNGLEKMIADISDDKPKSNLKKAMEHRRHHSGDSLASQSSTSTQLSASQQSISSDQKPDGIQTSYHQPLSNPPIANQQTSQTLSTNQTPAQTLSAAQRPPQRTTPVPITNHIPTVIESVCNPSNSITPPPISSAKQSSKIQVSIPDSQSSTPVVSPGASKKSRKRRRSAASTDSKHSGETSVGQYKCLWEGCGLGFSSCPLLRKHVSQGHTTRAGACVWAGCDRIERKRWALVSHMTDKHTSNAALAEALANREKGIVPVAVAAPLASPSIYTPQAAKIAIMRNYPKTPFAEFTDVREGPVTKHIRFTAALILRNVCRYSSTGKTLLKKHEGNLAVIAGSAMEAASPVLNCLWEMQHSPHSL
ncbi:AT-rich interactive domain-containing protein 2-like [Watersipora subatra]|uniref:AT-rich interactive domain-containing protein 2-like n=1 Tax=Watersipora subatra TaxID=2589382 RepID=UPI00355AECD5